jgi:hypothetical protein
LSPSSRRCPTSKAARAQPGKLNVGTINVGTQNLGAELLKSLAQVISRSSPTAVRRHHRRAAANDAALVEFYARSSRRSPQQDQAVAGSGHNDRLPDVPRRGRGVPVITSWNGVFARSERRRVCAAEQPIEIVAMPDVKQRLGIEPASETIEGAA